MFVYIRRKKLEDSMIIREGWNQEHTVYQEVEVFKNGVVIMKHTADKGQFKDTREWIDDVLDVTTLYGKIREP